MWDGLGGQEDPVNAKRARAPLGAHSGVCPGLAEILSAGQRLRLSRLFPAKKEVPLEASLFGGTARARRLPRKLLSPVAAQAAAGTGMDLSLLHQGREAPAGMAHARMGPSSRLSSSSSTGPKSATGNGVLWRLLMLQIFPCSVLAPAEAPDNAKAAVSQFFCNIICVCSPPGC